MLVVCIKLGWWCLDKLHERQSMVFEDYFNISALISNWHKNKLDFDSNRYSLPDCLEYRSFSSILFRFSCLSLTTIDVRVQSDGIMWRCRIARLPIDGQIPGPLFRTHPHRIALKFYLKNLVSWRGYIATMAKSKVRQLVFCTGSRHNCEAIQTVGLGRALSGIENTVLLDSLSTILYSCWEQNVLLDAFLLFDTVSVSGRNFGAAAVAYWLHGSRRDRNAD